MEKRLSELLNLVIKTHIKTAEPIGSRFLVEKCDLGRGEATVRNELRELEEQGYLRHPHTSAGRIPTEKGYRYYLKNLDLARAKLTKKDNDVFGMSVSADTDKENAQKVLVKNLTALSNATAILAFSPDQVYYTGLSNLFSQPEFSELALVADVTQIFDHCEDCLENFSDEVTTEIKYFFGPEHGFGNLLSVAAFRFGDESLLILLGPMRMDYARNYALMNKIKELI
ncbi:MAG: hypothetical protein A3J93_00435 [Candidatus Magasanikbacteria bacterium RIFOXYC2_FULL_42_28]|uniref:Heat-inducible transcription repressor HrcA C-terminal domain-containing protein n=1 Tax=Candidatus Magasanikbacteria bacterium RIFOXYC2_FULL_42_28 TaxID=1798704 RepID=A0A1F6NW89_9BACT|nr:MAG: hypothetical protein A3J93_00435 [Candidatus Magasanikbacteria bacterium RIFOXYC2_FULL_42_28]